jgi:hypothetical protein
MLPEGRRLQVLRADGGGDGDGCLVCCAGAATSAGALLPLADDVQQQLQVLKAAVV